LPQPPYFTPESLRFLRALGRHNQREWFTAHKDVYQSAVHAPTLRLCEDLTRALAQLAPRYATPAPTAMMRIYTNLRFHADRPPYKTKLGAWWGARGLERTSGAGFYVHFGLKDFEIAAGCFQPSPEQRLRIRQAIARDARPFRAALAARSVKRLLPSPVCPGLQRAPKGFSPSDPAIDLLKCEKWGAMTLLPPEAALEPGLDRLILARFRAALPLVELLNAAIAAGAPRARGLHSA